MRKIRRNLLGNDNFLDDVRFKIPCDNIKNVSPVNKGTAAKTFSKRHAKGAN